MQKRGKFVVLEGIDGVGTTSMAKEITEYFVARKLPVETTQEPYSAELGGTLRKFISGEFDDPGWMAMSLLFSADRAIHCKDLTRILSQGMNVICDRYLGSTVAYQSAMAPEEDFDEAMRFITGPLSYGVVVPDITIYLKAGVDVCAMRRSAGRYGKAEDYYERLDIQLKVAEAYESWVQYELTREDSKLFVVIDANRSYEEVRRDCIGSVQLVL